jgi:putative flippase GtrA
MELSRYILNGIFATIIHYGMLILNIEILGIPSAGLSNMIAALFGITFSFLGSRYFVFCHVSEKIHLQAMKFLSLYLFIAFLHGLTLLIWTDLYGMNHNAGFLLASIMQFILSYLGNKLLVFKS